VSERRPSDWLAGLIGGVLVLGLAGAYNLASDLGQPFGGFLVFHSALSRAWQVEASTPPWWPALADGQLRYDDQLLAIDGQPYGADAQRVFLAVQTGGRSHFELTVKRGDQRVNLRMPLQRFSFSDLVNVKLPDLVTGLGFWLLAVAVYRAGPAVPLNRVFALSGALLAGALWTTIESLYPEGEPLAVALRIVWILLNAFIGTTFVHVTTLFLAPLAFSAMRLLQGLYGVSGLIGAAYALATLLRLLGLTHPGLEAAAEFGYRFGLGALGAGALFFAGRMAWLFTRPGSPRLRRQLALLLISVLAAIPYLLVIVVRALVEQSQGYFLGGLDLRYLALAVPLAFAYLILRYQTFQSTHPLLFGVLALALSALLASLGAWLLRVGGVSLGDSDGVVFLLMFVIALGASAFWGSQSAWQTAFNRLFRWERRSYAAAREVGQQVGAPMSLGRLPGLIAQALVDKLELRRAAVWLWREDEGALTLAGRAGEAARALGEQLPARAPYDVRRPVRLNAEGAPAWLDPLLGSGLEVIAPLWASGEFVGLLGLGARMDEEIFDERDVEISEWIAQQAALLLLAASQVEQLRQVPHQVATAQERERLHLAQELHDTVQQFLGRLPFYLQVSLNAARTKPEETEAILQRLLGEVESAAQSLRQIRLNLAPAQLEAGLLAPLRALVARFEANTGVETNTALPPELDEALTAEARHALYRVVQQALDNIAAHAQARHVTLEFAATAGRVEFTIADDGRGFTEQAAAEARARGSFGLTSMQARLTSLGGALSIESQTGAGTRLAGWLPARPR
jgi:signal transduction histidine kinase